MFQFQSALRESDEGGAIIDMSGVSYMDSAGLGVLLGQGSHAQRVAKKFALAALSARVQNILRITHTDKVLPVFATVARCRDGAESACRLIFRGLPDLVDNEHFNRRLRRFELQAELLLERRRTDREAVRHRERVLERRAAHPVAT